MYFNRIMCVIYGGVVVGGCGWGVGGGGGGGVGGGSDRPAPTA